MLSIDERIVSFPDSDFSGIQNIKTGERTILWMPRDFNKLTQQNLRGETDL